MNDAHLHLVVNHFPIIGSILGLGILVFGFLIKNNSIKNTAYSLFIVAAIFAAISMATGEGAEELVEDLPDVGHHIIHEHEEHAEKLALVLYATAVFSILAFVTTVKKHKFAKITSIITLLLSIAAVALGTQVGTSGGEIRHTEIRNNSQQIPQNVVKHNSEKDEE